MRWWHQCWAAQPAGATSPFISDYLIGSHQNQGETYSRQTLKIAHTHPMVWITFVKTRSELLFWKVLFTCLHWPVAQSGKKTPNGEGRVSKENVSTRQAVTACGNYTLKVKNKTKHAGPKSVSSEIWPKWYHLLTKSMKRLLELSSTGLGCLHKAAWVWSCGTGCQ